MIAGTVWYATEGLKEAVRDGFLYVLCTVYLGELVWIIWKAPKAPKE